MEIVSEVTMENVLNQNYKSKKSNTILLLLISAFFVQLFFRMLDYLKMLKFLDSRSLIYIDLLLVAISAFYIIVEFFRKIPIKRYSVFGTFSFFYFFSLIISLLNRNIYPSFINNFATQSLWYAALSVFWVFVTSEDEIDYNFIKKLLFVSSLGFSIIYLLWIIGRTAGTEGYINSLYFGLCLLPTVFLNKKLWFQIVVAGVLTVNVALSGKRAALLILLFGFLLPFLTSVSDHQKKRSINTIILVFLAVFLVYNYISTRYDIVIFERMDNIIEDGGSGRDKIYEKVWLSFKESSILKQLFGHGFNAVSLASFARTSAHNDFLEILYDCGVVGVTAYLWMIIKLIGYSRKLYAIKSDVAPMFFSALIIFLILSTVSHLIIYPTYIIFLLFFFSLGIYDLNRIERNNSQ